jgi:predicted small secreted protein
MWIITAVTTNLIFLIEMILHFVIFDLTWITHMKKILFVEILLQICFFLAVYKFIYGCYTVNGAYEDIISGINICCIVYLFRSLRLLRHFTELKDFDIIFSTFLGFSKPFF